MTLIRTDRTFTIQDPRTFDGDPYQVAERAIHQLNGLVILTLGEVEPATLMVRNADLERTLALDGSLGNAGREWPESPQGKQLRKVQNDLEQARKRLDALALASAYNPKAR